MGKKSFFCYYEAICMNNIQVQNCFALHTEIGSNANSLHLISSPEIAWKAWKFMKKTSWKYFKFVYTSNRASSSKILHVRNIKNELIRSLVYFREFKIQIFILVGFTWLKKTISHIAAFFQLRKQWLKKAKKILNLCRNRMHCFHIQCANKLEKIHQSLNSSLSTFLLLLN